MHQLRLAHVANVDQGFAGQGVRYSFDHVDACWLNKALEVTNVKYREYDSMSIFLVFD